MYWINVKGRFSTDDPNLFLQNLKLLMQQTKTIFNGEITQQLIQVFNGQFVEGVGTMIFNKKRSARCRAFESGLKPYKGKILLFANNCLS